MRMNTIEVIPYNPNWPKMFAVEAELIKQALGDNCIAIHHIGSTSVPGLSAKPIIDILPVVQDIQAVDQATAAMEALGYDAKGEYGIAFRRYFQKGGNTRTHNVHAFQEGDPEIGRYLKFRDWLRTHPADAEAYAQLKQQLANQTQDILQYCNGKDSFVASIDAKDGYDGWRMVQALLDREWSKVGQLRQSYFKSAGDPYSRTPTDPEHIHFVFYRNADVIGYAHLQLLPEHQAALRFIAIDDPHRHQGYGRLLLKLCERWLAHRGFRNLVVNTPKEVLSFYSRQGYIPIIFNDLDKASADSSEIQLVKTLIC
jgi:GrpB-like predicted nucleotidyltransferase (UPF0157 family)/GNAT superfamily N-acetyltransferase